MFEKVNPCHPDKVADRVAGALVDLAYTKSHDPKIAVEVLIGHGQANVIVETSEDITADECHDAVVRIAGPMPTYSKVVRQDAHLAQNQADGFRCGDNGIFKGTPVTHEQKLLTAIAASIYEKYPTDGKYLITDMYERWPNLDGGPDKLSRVPGGHELTICQSNAKTEDIQELIWTFFAKNKASVYPGTFDRAQIGTDMYFWMKNRINPLGPWTGGPDVDTGATNRKLGSDMGDSVTGGGLMGKDLSKADVSVNIACWLRAQQSGQTVTACCAIGDKDVTFVYHDGKTVTQSFSEIVEQARLYILTIGGFEKFAEWGLIRAKEE